MGSERKWKWSDLFLVFIIKIIRDLISGSPFLFFFCLYMYTQAGKQNQKVISTWNLVLFAPEAPTHFPHSFFFQISSCFLYCRLSDYNWYNFHYRWDDLTAPHMDYHRDDSKKTETDEFGDKIIKQTVRVHHSYKD